MNQKQFWAFVGMALILVLGCNDDSPVLQGVGVDELEITAVQCRDGEDNDGDGAVDCDDEECRGFVFCVDEDTNLDNGERHSDDDEDSGSDPDTPPVDTHDSDTGSGSVSHETDTGSESIDTASATESESGSGSGKDGTDGSDTGTETDSESSDDTVTEDTGTVTETETDTGSGILVPECSDGATRCDGEMVQHCIEGVWTDYDDCPVNNLTCTTVAGVSQCVDTCRNGDRRCNGQMIQACEDGAWIDHDDCPVQGKVCTVVAGEYMCVNTHTACDDGLGCYINTKCYLDGAFNPENGCQRCDVTQSLDSFVDADGTTCSDGDPCNGADTCSAGTCSIHEGNPCEEGTNCLPTWGTNYACCAPEDHLGCNADGDVVWFDSCNQPGEVFEDCVSTENHGVCQDGECACEPNWQGANCDECVPPLFGKECDRCIVYVKKQGDDERDGWSWTNAKATVQAGIDAAEDFGCEVWVSKGTYHPTVENGGSASRYKTILLAEGVGIYGGFVGNETQRSQRDFKNNVTTLSGDIGTTGDEADNAFHVVTAMNNTTIDGFTITQGRAFGAHEYGGGVLYGEDTITESAFVSNCILTDNLAASSGGGIYISEQPFFDSPLFTFSNCTFSKNSASSGGALYARDGAVSLTDSKFSNNSATSRGGAIYNYRTTVIVSKSTFSNNSAEYSGGAIYNYGTVIVSNSTFSKNSAESSGGAILDSDKMTVSKSTFSNNSAVSSGGAIYFGGNESLIDSTLFIHNSAQSGGGIANYDASPLIFNSIFSQNSAFSKPGGALFNTYSSPTISSCTFYNNTAQSGGNGIYNTDGSWPEITNSIFWSDTEVEQILDEEDPQNPSQSTLRYTNIQGGFSGEGNTDQDPNFIDTTANPPDLRLRSGSPCIDAGNTFYLPADSLDLDSDEDLDEAIPFDLDGNPRVVGAGVDMGAYEIQ